MTGFNSKREAAADKFQENVPLYVSKTAFGSWREFASDYERGFIDGMQKQAQSSVDKAVNQMAQPAQERDFSCKVCGNKPNSDGELEHGKGCYTQDENGGGSEFISDAVTAPQPAQEPVREALKLALGALDSENPDIQCRAALAIRAALAQPAQEPVAFESFLESQDFYELMQTYRHCLTDALLPFEEVKDALRAAHIGSKP